MNRTLFNVLLVATGAAVGSVVTWKVVSTKYERLIQGEIDSVKEELAKMYEDHREVDSEPETDARDTEESDSREEAKKDDIFEPSEDEVFEYHKIASGYRSREDVKVDTDKGGGAGDLDETPYINGPYVISPDDFRCSPPGYNAQALDYFADGVLADSWGNEMDIEETIGEDSLDHFGEYVDDIVYVRNERKEIDYEVTYDQRRYEEVYNSGYDV